VQNPLVRYAEIMALKILHLAIEMAVLSDFWKKKGLGPLGVI